MPIITLLYRFHHIGALPVVSFPGRDRARAIEVTKMLVAYYSKGEVPVSNRYSVYNVRSLHDNLAIYLTNRLLRSLIPCSWVGYRSRSTVSYLLCPHASYLPFRIVGQLAVGLQLDLYLPAPTILIVAGLAPLSGGWINTRIGVGIVRSFSCRFSLPSCWNIRPLDFSWNSRYKRTSTC